ncbi:transposase [Candidatus Giovannonibacteria bacterium]|nr:transposase [Candidatus Giovannonibacteria bacterium]
MKRGKFGSDQYFHIYNRGVEKRTIFNTDDDRYRFMLLLILMQADVPCPQIGRLLPSVKHQMFDNEIFPQIINKRSVELISFCLMPNHYHLIIRELAENGISKFMQRLSDSYTKYFNIKYDRSGHLFGSKFQAINIDRNEYLNYLSAYIHLNPRELKDYYHKEVRYKWSSFQDFVFENRWGAFLNPSIILDQFDDGNEYKIFVGETPIKEIASEVESQYLIDSS